MAYSLTRNSLPLRDTPDGMTTSESPSWTDTTRTGNGGRRFCGFRVAPLRGEAGARSLHRVRPTDTSPF